MYESKEQNIPSAKLRRYKGMFLRAAEEVFVDDPESELPIGNCVGILTDTTQSKRKRTAAAMGIVHHFMPQKVNKLVAGKLAYSQDELPFNPREYKLRKKIGTGGMNDVFLLESTKGESSYAMKVVIEGVGETNIDNLVTYASQQRTDYEKVSAKFTHIPDLVLPEYYFIANGPRRGQLAAISIQPFLGKNVRDIFEDVNKAELIDLLQTNDKLKSQLQAFIETVRNDPSLIEDELDLIGKCNLAIVGDKGNERLILLDPHSRSEKERADHFKKEIARRVKYLSEICSDNQTQPQN